MGYVKSFIYEFLNTYTVDDRVITIMFAAIFLPWQLALVVSGLVTLFLLIRTDFIATFKRVKYAKVLFVFGVYLLIVSAFHQDWLGVLTCVGLLACFVNIIHYREFIHRPLLEQIIDIALLLSIIALLVSVCEQYYYTTIVDGMSFLDIQNKPAFRIHWYYMNANYCAYVSILLIGMCAYKFFRIKTIAFRFYYVGIALVNAFILYLSGGRIAWLALGLGLIVMLFVNKWYKLFGLSIFAAGGLGAFIFIKLPRFASRGLKLERRLQIWRTALLMIEDDFLFGKGPLGYLHTYGAYEKEYIAQYGLKSFEQYKLGISANHAHTMFLEPIVSYGIIGTIVLLWYLGYELKCAFLLAYRKIDATLSALLLGSIVMTLVFCIMDFPLFYIQTGYLLLLLLGSSDLYKKELH